MTAAYPDKSYMVNSKRVRASKDTNTQYYKNNLKITIKLSGTEPRQLEACASDRAVWRSVTCLHRFLHTFTCEHELHCEQWLL
ncbi:hypothetical protein RRG08_013791 [Elysia crispata]|uniref:Uncharacterized protein n=1 Tax=Elysia crispata TaxID=231223 RepID=A0AAE1BBR4_9GAST|nr:hypothetical protein RRG08_013791 [Elysia crispata]